MYIDKNYATMKVQLDRISIFVFSKINISSEASCPHNPKIVKYELFDM